jgi:hypothetical protein
MNFSSRTKNIHPTIQAIFKKNNISRFGRYRACCYLPEGIIYIVLFREMVYINRRNLIDTLKSSFMDFFVVRGDLKDSNFWIRNVHIHPITSNDGQARNITNGGALGAGLHALLAQYERADSKQTPLSCRCMKTPNQGGV